MVGKEVGGVWQRGFKVVDRCGNVIERGIDVFEGVGGVVGEVVEVIGEKGKWRWRFTWGSGLNG
ncbi:hypothetical protein, partial [Paenibacillus xylanexedens]|uniref:hypothetical protein n=1 Tax=Paenibacillus xylanexedens TaxID=528191 RepID=UPI001C92D2BA